MNTYVADPTAQHFADMSAALKVARSVGINTYRLPLQLFDFVERDINGTLRMNQSAVEAYQDLLAEALRLRIYVVVVGNNVWQPELDPRPWYDTMSHQERWDVQAFFFEEIAGPGASSPVIAAYELANEPLIATRTG